MAARGPRLWETLQTLAKIFYLDLTAHALRGNRKSENCLVIKLEFAFTKAGEDSNFKLKTEQKSSIEAVVCQKKDVLGALPSGFGKSFVFHLLLDI